MDTAARSDTKSAKPGFYDNFLQDRNIKWILASGAAILLGSSVMLVTSQWSGYSAVLKEAIILAYTYGIFAAGKYGYERVGLRRTGTMLLALAVLLAPAACAALPWVWQAESWNVGFGLLLAACGALSYRIGSQAFRHFLLAPQPTLTASYVLLALAGGILPLLTWAQAPWMAGVLWMVFAVGACKGNRRVFWLLEEHRRPRIVGFFPLALLGAQFLGVFALVYAERTSLAWCGFGCVLTAVPLLLAADALAAVFQQRTGDLVRPLPSSILSPLLCGLLLVAAGVVLSGTEIAGGRPLALVPSAALAAGLLALTARRTGRGEFVYAGVALVVVAYRFLPVYAAEAVRALLQNAAAAIHEPRLPIAYYGFTFVPLLAAFSALGVWRARRGDELFAAPLRRSAIGLSLAFLALAITHEKAMFPAAATLTLVFAAQAVAFRNRLLVVPGIVGLVLASFGLPHFYNGVLLAGPLAFTGLPLWGADAEFACLLIVTVLLLATSKVADRAIRRLPLPSSSQTLDPLALDFLESPLRRTSLTLTGMLMALWAYRLATSPFQLPSLPLQFGVVALGLSQAWLHRHTAASVAAVGFANIVVGYALGEMLPSENAYFIVQTVVLLAQWSLGMAFKARPRSRAAQTFGPALRFCTSAGLRFGFAAMALPLHGFCTLTDWIVVDQWGLWIPSLLLLSWAFAAAYLERSRTLLTLAAVALFAYVGSALRCGDDAAFAWALPAWVVTAAMLVAARRISKRLSSDLAKFTAPLDYLASGASLMLFVGSCFTFSLPATVAGLTAPLVLGLSLVAAERSQLYRLPFALLNARLLLMAFGLMEPSLENVGQLTFADIAANAPSLALVTALSLAAWRYATRRDDADEQSLPTEIGKAQCAALALVVAGLMCASLALPSLAPLSLIAAVATFVVCITLELVAACQTGDERRVWSAQLLAAVGIGYLASFRVIHFGQGWSMYVCLLVGAALWLVAKLAERSPTTAVLCRPFRTTAALMPAGTVGLALYRHLYLYEILRRPTPWLGWNSLALLLAAAFYFRRGVEARDRRYTVAAATILNLAIALLWRELRFVDPQFYMIPLGITVLTLVELLEREIPADYRNPLRYVGALVILVSPTFHIVDGSWLHLFSLMVAAVVVLLAGIGLRTRAMVYAGTAFLLADLAAMVVRGSIDHPELLWVAGLGLGAAILGLGAACELGRERVQQRVRAIGSALESWK
ncbi:MAG: hypothetical protein JNK76_09185 [Planctomycetales bacterium]|nr:hypothetical protein [Planctomycetales bacterium]